MKISNIDIKEVQDYWDRRPCNIRHSKLPIGTKEYFDEVEKRKYFVEPHILDFVNFPKWQNKKVLEIGCGIGTDAINFARHGAIYTGLELSQESLRIAVDRMSRYGLKGTLLQGNAELMQDCIEVTAYDLIYSFGVLHHTPNIQKALDNMRSFCHPETELKIMVYATNSIKKVMIDANLSQPEAQSGCPIANTFSAEEIKEILFNSNFEVTSISQDHIFPYKISEYVNHIYKKENWIEAMSPELFRLLEKNFGWHLLIEARPIN